MLEVVRHISAHAVSAGHHVAVAHGRRPETPADVERLIDGRVELFPMPWTQRTIAAQAKTAYALRRLIASWRPDVIHLHSSFAGAVGVVAVPRRHRVVYSPHAFASSMQGLPEWRRTAIRGVERMIVHAVTVVGAVSESEAQYARDELAPGQVEVVANGISELDAPGPPPSQPPEVPRVCAMGRIGPQRQPAAAARVLGELADEADVVWLGDEGRMGAGADELRAAGVRVTGWLAREEVLRELRQSTVYLHWTAWDGQPIAILEALALGVPVVASDIPPSREILGQEQVCRTEGEAVQLIRQLLERPEGWQGALRRQSVLRERYSARRMAEGWLTVYERLTGRAGIRPAPAS